MVMRDDSHHHHHHHSSTGNGVTLSSSIALLQKRFRQLQKMKELRQGKQLLRSLMLSESERLSSYVVNPRHKHEYDQQSCKAVISGNMIMSSDEPMLTLFAPPIQQRCELSLSLSPDINHVDSRNKIINREPAPQNIKLQSYNHSDIDTSLRL